MTLLTVRQYKLNPEYWGLPKISGQWFLWPTDYPTIARTKKRTLLNQATAFDTEEK